MALTLESIGFKRTSREIHDYYKNLRDKGNNHREARAITVMVFRPQAKPDGSNPWKSPAIRAEFNNLVNLAIL